MLPNWLYGKSLRKLQEILNSGGQTAAGVSYSNTESGLEATNAQAAIDEVVEDVTRLDRDAVKVVGGGLIDVNSSRSFTCTDYEGYRLSIYSIGANSIGMIVLFGKHPSVSDVRLSIFNCENRNPDAPQISASGSTLTITTAAYNCYYIVERIKRS